MHNLMTMFGANTPADAIWITVGLLGQLMFTGRFIVQWIASEKAGRSVVPVAFWYFSILGGLIVLAYGIHKLDPVIIVGQLPGVVIYSRNLWLIKKHADRRADGQTHMAASCRFDRRGDHAAALGLAGV